MGYILVRVVVSILTLIGSMAAGANYLQSKGPAALLLGWVFLGAGMVSLVVLFIETRREAEKQAEEQLNTK